MNGVVAGTSANYVGNEEIDIGGVGRAISRRLWLILLIAFICAALMTAFVNLVKPRYTAEARLLLENQESYFTRPEKSSTGDFSTMDPEGGTSQVQIVTSRDVGRRVIRELKLQGNPEFDPAVESTGPVSRVAILLGLKRDPTRLSPEDRILEVYLEKLTAFSPPKTRVISIEFQSKNPELAAAAANKIAETYISLQRETKRASAKSAAASLQGLIADLRVKVAHAEAEAEAFRTRTGLLPVMQNVTMTTQQLSDINTQLSAARSAQADAQAKARLIRDMIRKGRVSEAPDVANNEHVRRITEQRTSLRAQIASESRTLLDGHPRMQELTAQLHRIDQELIGAADKAARTLENESRVAGARVESLSAALDRQKKVSGVAGADEVQYRELERNARLMKDQLESATTRYQEAMARESAESAPADARIISTAVAPQYPTFPKKGPLIAFAFLGGLIASAAFVVASELLTGKAGAATAPGYVAYEVAPAAPAVEPQVVVDAVEPPAQQPPFQERRSMFSRLRRAGQSFGAPKEPLIDMPPAAAQGSAAPAAPAATAAATATAAAVERVRGAAQGRSAPVDPHVGGASASVEAPVAQPAHEASAPVARDGHDAVAHVTAKILAGQVFGRATRALFAGVDIAEAGALALPVARALARDARVVAIDLDRERPTLDRVRLGADDSGEGPGLSNLLSGAATFSQVLHRDRATRLHIVQPGDRPIHDLLAFDSTVEALSATYDFIVLIAPSTARDDLAESIAGMADIAIVVAPGRGADKAARAAFEGMLASGAGEILVVDQPRPQRAPRHDFT
jgi:succinoglycan biosynthesis transport protein ExoP